MRLVAPEVVDVGAQVQLVGRYALISPVFRLLLPVLVGRVLDAIKRTLESSATRDGDVVGEGRWSS